MARPSGETSFSPQAEIEDALDDGSFLDELLSDAAARGSDAFAGVSVAAADGGCVPNVYVDRRGVRRSQFVASLFPASDTVSTELCRHRTGRHRLGAPLAGADAR